MSPSLLPRRLGVLAAALLAAAALVGSTLAAGAASGPAATVVPRVAGQAAEGNRIYGARGTWSGSGKIAYAFRWFRCDQMGGDCARLAGMTAQSYLLGPDDVGHTISLEVTATDASGSTTAVSGLIGPIAGAPAVLFSTVQPTVSGKATLGSILEVEPGTWSPAPDAVTYQWVRCSALGRSCEPIAGATAITHQVTDSDLGHALVAIVQARSGTSLQAVFSAAVPPETGAPADPGTPVDPGADAEAGRKGPSSVAPPIIGLVVQQGGQLTGAVGTWAGSGPITFAYQWYRCDALGAHCTSVRGASSRTYTFGARDVGHLLGLTVRATDRTGTTSAYASLVGPVAGPTAALVSTGQPTISGLARAGSRIKVSAGSWRPAPTSLAYRWQRCNANGRLCVAVAGATSSSYAVTAADAGHALVAVVRAASGGVSQDAVSLATAPVPGVRATGPTSTVRPVVGGPGQVGTQLAGSVGVWAGTGTIAYAYQWYRCDPTGAHCTTIRGATQSTYTTVAKDVGRTLGFGVEATDSTGTATAHASLIGPIVAAGAPLVATAQPAVTGVARPGQTLQVSAGGWSRTPASVTYQWLRCNQNGRLCVPIPGATAAGYPVVAADVGHVAVVLVTAQADAATPGTTLSTASALIGP